LLIIVFIKLSKDTIKAEFIMNFQKKWFLQLTTL
jgi:hypothetical protein